jgi:molybdopterin-guanine dinucleotide biosynthesis protein A
VEGALRDGTETKRVSGYVLAGGGSTRFGQDKALAKIDGLPMLLRMRDLVRETTREVQVIAGVEKYEALGIAGVPDRWDGQGPLAGIITALLTTQEASVSKEWNLIVGCDMPFLTREWLSYLSDRALASQAEIVAPKSAQGLEPLCACWRTNAAAKLQRIFEGGIRKITEAMRRLDIEIVDEKDWKRFDSAGRLFWNMNTATDYDEAKRILEGQRT